MERTEGVKVVEVSDELLTPQVEQVRTNTEFQVEDEREKERTEIVQRPGRGGSLEGGTGQEQKFANNPDGKAHSEPRGKKVSLKVVTKGKGKKAKVTQAGMNKWEDLCNPSHHEDDQLTSKVRISS